jgi:hypothetical protein
MSPAPTGANAKITAALEINKLPTINATSAAKLPLWFRVVERPIRREFNAENVIPKHNPRMTAAASQRREFKNAYDASPNGWLRPHLPTAAANVALTRQAASHSPTTRRVRASTAMADSSEKPF